MGDIRNYAILAAMFFAALCVTCAAAELKSLRPVLFMDPEADALDRWGLLIPRPHAVQRSGPQFACPPENYTTGATVVAAFELSNRRGYEVFVVIGRGGEPVAAEGTAHGRQAQGTGHGISVRRYETENLLHYSDAIEVLFLPDGPPSLAQGLGRPLDGQVWTVKSIAKDDASGKYLLAAAYQTFVFIFTSSEQEIRTPLSFKPAAGSPRPSFDDHDDTNLIFSPTSKHPWVDLQVIFENHTDFGRQPNSGRKFCDNAGCTKRRVVTTRTSRDGIGWSNPAGCIAASACWRPGQDPAIEQCCVSYNASAMLLPDARLDPPELQFYRLRPFYLGDSRRLVGHMTLYAPVPEIMSNNPKYGYRTSESVSEPAHLKCRTTDLRPGVKSACHGPHMHEEWVLGSPSGDPADATRPGMGWTRPFAAAGYAGTHAAPHDIWLMAQPLVSPNRDSHIFVADGSVWQLPLYRLAGLYSPANVEFSTIEFQVPSTQLLLNVDAAWQGGPITGGCDEGCAAYVLVELLDASGNVVPQFSKHDFDPIMDVDGANVPLTWRNRTSVALAGDTVRARIYARAATLYAILT